MNDTNRPSLAHAQFLDLAAQGELKPIMEQLERRIQFLEQDYIQRIEQLRLGCR